MDSNEEEALFDIHEQRLQENNDESEQQLSVVDHRNPVLRDVRRHYGKIITHQHEHIGVLDRKLHMLKIVSGVLLILLIIIKFSRGSCEIEPSNTSEIQQTCLNQKEYYNCDKEQGKTNAYRKICEEITFCLKDPLTYKQNMDEKKWK